MNSNLDKIEHIVVLMLENRSFDNMLGFLGASDPGGQKVDGVAGKALSNPVPPYVPNPEGCIEVPVGMETDMTHPNPDPGEEYAHVNTQLFGRVIPPENREPPFDEKASEPYNLPVLESYTDPPMNGFVTDYINHFRAVEGRWPTYDEYRVIMNCHTEDSLPVLSTLAKEYAVFDRWFASVPSQTICNRAFLHTGTSQGEVLNAPYYTWLGHNAPTLFNRMSDQKDPQVTWRIYFDRLDVVSFTGLLHRPLWPYRHSHFSYIEDFETDAANGTLPGYSFVEPRFFMGHNDQHPPVGKQSLVASNVLAGELLINRIYDAVRKGKNWERTLLIITYDEHGGCYDHVPPPEAVPPDPARPAGKQGFRFDRLGVRVPTVMVSPYIKKGTVISDVHDHTSIIKAVCDRWSLEPLTDRDRNASSFARVLNRETPRSSSEIPVIEPRPYSIPRNVLDEPINPLQRMILFVMAGYEDAHRVLDDKRFLEKVEDILQLVLDEMRIAHIRSVGQAIHFSIGFDRRVTKHLSFRHWLHVRLKLLYHRLRALGQRRAPLPGVKEKAGGSSL